MAEGAEGKGNKEEQQGSAQVPPATATSEAANEAAGTEADPAWPPREAAPRDVAPDDPATMTLPATSEPAAGKKSAADAQVVMLPTEADAQVGAALPGQEMGFSDSTLHWLEDGETTGTHRTTSPTGSLPSYDPRAPIAGRKRAVLVVGGAGALALIVAGTLFFQARSRPAPAVPAVTKVEPARDLTARAEAALAANQISEALDLAHLALAADQRHADAHFVMAKSERARNQSSAARDEYRKYLELAPLGLHAAEARQALDSLPQ